MSIKSSDLDAIFNGAGAVVNSTANVCNAVAQGINDVQSCLDMSRRNQQYNQSGYGYGDTSGYPSTGYNGFQSQNNQAGYVGFTDPSYGSFSSNNTNPNGFYGNGQNNRGGYWG